MEIHILGNLSMAELMGKESTPGQMVKSMTASGIKVLSKAMGSGEASRTIRTSVNGRPQRLMDMVFTHGPTVIDMKASGTCASSTVKVQTHLPTVTAITESIRTASLMEEASTPGLRVNNMSVNSNLAKSMDSEDGNHRRIRRVAISMKVNIGMISNMVKGCIHGVVETSIKVSTLKMRGMVTVKCCGPMAACMKENGLKVFSTAKDEWSLPMAQQERAISRTTFSKSHST